MTGYQSKKAAAQDEDGMYLVHHTKGRTFDKFGNKVTNDEDDDTQVYKDQGDALVVAYQSGYYNGKKTAQQERNFCPRCGKRTNDIHTCTPPQENT
jgi:hypothetical protein